MMWLRLVFGAFVFLGPWSNASEIDSCPAEGCALENLSCVKWRQTVGCDPKGSREKSGDKECHEEIGIGSSGYCQCASSSSSERVKARAVSCDHRPFRCSTECLQAVRYRCISWRQTGGCSADGTREPNKDQTCRALIDPRSSGYCECGGGRIIRKPGCAHGEWAEPFTCLDECAGEASLYEELGVDSSASDKEIKQAFRKLSLVHHPDKTRNDPVLTARFSQIREAYEILGDKGQRAIYDSAGLQLLYQFLSNKAEKGQSSTTEVKVTLEHMYNGQLIQVSVPRVLVCRGCREWQTERCRRCNTRCADELEYRKVRMGNMIVQQQVQVPSKEKCRSEHHPVTLMVERGSSNGDTLIFQHRGGLLTPKKVPGDVIVKLVETKHVAFRRAGVDLHTEVTITLREALLGFERTLQHLDGRTIYFGHKGVTKPFAVMKISKEGMPHKDPTEKGDLYIKCKVEMPEDGLKWLEEMKR